LPDSQGIETFDTVHAQSPEIPIIVLTITDNDEIALEAVRKGAQDYLVKEQIDAKTLVHAIRYAIERKWVQETLRETNLFLQNILESSDAISIVYTDCKGTILYWNTGAENIFGYTAEEVIGRRTADILYPQDDAGTRQSIEEVKSFIFREKQGTSCEVREVTKDGRTLWINLHVTPRFDDHGQVIGILGIGQDITERKRAEGQLRGQALIFENIRDGIIMTDLQGNIMSWNPAAERMFGYYQDEVFQKTIELLRTKIIKGTLCDGRWTGEMDFIRKDGTNGVCETTVVPLRDENDNITAVFGVAHDITERKQTEKELQRSYDRLRETLIATVNALASTVEMRDPYTAGHQRRVTLLACAIAEEMGLTNDQFDGLRMAGLIHDLGKINVPAEVLSKPGRINDIEFSIIQFHPQICHDILKTIELPWPVATIVLQHHERLDGSGYPQGLKDGEIMLEARILAVADVVEAMASHRPYRPSLGIKLALEEITKHRGTLYDPDVIDACIKLFTEKKFKFE
jgi:PAS domain S-box-containing protein